MILIRRLRVSKSIVSNLKRNFSYVSEKDLLERVPYNFEGVKASINPNSTYKVYQFLHQILGDKLDNGFKFAYESFLDAFENKDLEFF